MPAVGRGCLALLVLGLGAAACSTSPGHRAGPVSTPTPLTAAAGEQAPGWSHADLDFFLHGSMSAEVVPERVLRAFIAAYPDLFTTPDLSSFGLLADRAFGWPIGFSRREVPHLAGLPSVGVNCAACHVGEVVPASGGPPVRVLGMPSHFDAEAFFGALTLATFRTAEPAAMRRWLSAYLDAGDSGADEAARRALAAAWERHEPRITAAMAAERSRATASNPEGLHAIRAEDLRLDGSRLKGDDDLVPVIVGSLRLFHNMRAALHIPDELPARVPPPSGPGRNDAFGLLSAALLGVPQPYAPVKYGVVWNLGERRWVHWDGNTQSPIGRNVLASLGLGAPLVGRRAWLDVAAVQRHTDLSETLRAPRYPFAVDAAAAARGRTTFGARCAVCHGGAETDARLHDVGTDPTRARAFSQAQADRFNALLASLQAPGYRPPSVPGLRGTERYWAPGLAGVWARAPYLHNGSVRTMQELLGLPASRAVTFHRGTRRYDTAAMGYADDGYYVVDTRTPGNASGGHAFGADLSAADRRDLIEYLKTL
jgi:Cytochrome c